MCRFHNSKLLLLFFFNAALESIKYNNLVNLTHYCVPPNLKMFLKIVFCRTYSVGIL